MRWRRKMSLHKGQTNSGSFKKGECKSPETQFKRRIRDCWKTECWRNSIFKRDNYQYQECGFRGKLSAHHIKEFEQILLDNNIKCYEEALNCSELWNLLNGITLYYPCHKQLHAIKRGGDYAHPNDLETINKAITGS